MVRVGDGLSCLYTGAVAIVLDDSANITLLGVSVYVAKGGPSETPDPAPASGKARAAFSAAPRDMAA